MHTLNLLGDVIFGWFVWSIGHNIGHRVWHHDMEQGKKTFVAHGESEHHRIYDGPIQRELHKAEDPKGNFISFPLAFVAAAGLLLALGFSFFFGRTNGVAFGLSMFVFMVADHQLHTFFHRRESLCGILGHFQRLHLIHHATHDRNFFFVSGFIWDILFGTFQAPKNTPAKPKLA